MNEEMKKLAHESLDKLIKCAETRNESFDIVDIHLKFYEVNAGPHTEGDETPLHEDIRTYSVEIIADVDGVPSVEAADYRHQIYDDSVSKYDEMTELADF